MAHPDISGSLHSSRNHSENKPLWRRQRAGLEALLDVPARQWSLSKKAFIRAVMRSLKRAAAGSVRHGELTEKVEAKVTAGTTED
ncbi:hypothetical protein ACG7TL_004919 [Trametes sanguinea]